MGLLGIDIGTSGCKAAVFHSDGSCASVAYEEYDVSRTQPGWAELDSVAVWGAVQRTISRAASGARGDPVRALAVSSLGEALVPVSRQRIVLGDAILNFDARGASYLPELEAALDAVRLYEITGNTLGNHYSLTKLMWLRDQAPRLYQQTDLLLPWGSFVSYMLGAEPVVDYSLANRTLLFDVGNAGWSEELGCVAGLDLGKMPHVSASGTAIGVVSDVMADALGLPRNVTVVTGAHDQCANAVGAGATTEGLAMYGIGTYACIVAPFAERRDARAMMAQGLNTEHHAAPGLYVTFMYNHGGSMLKWYRNTFAAVEHQRALQAGRSVYPELLAEMPAEPSGLVVLPHFALTGPPGFMSDSRGMVVGLTLETPRGAIAKGVLEGCTYYMRSCVEALPQTGISIDGYRAVGGGSQSDAWVQLSADILNAPIERPTVTEAGALGAAVLAGVGTGVFDSVEQGVEAMVRVERRFEPRSRHVPLYNEWYALYTSLWPRVGGFLAEVARAQDALS